jgi:signal transduction histidine kinase/CheY-like chemotaxis protein
VTPDLSERALILAPRGRDALVAADMLRETGVAATICRDIPALVGELEEGAGFALVTEEALLSGDLRGLREWLGRQPEWSDFPFVLLTVRGGGIERNPAAGRHLETLGNVTFLERPFHPTTLVSLARAAIRGRRRQYEARARMIQLRESEARYRTLFDTMDEGFCVVRFVDGPEGKLCDYVLLEANQAYERHSGVPFVAGQSARERYTDASGWVAMLREVLLTGQPIRNERQVPATNRFLEIAAFRVEPPERREVAVVFQDVTARRRAEQELQTLNTTLEKRVEDEVAAREVATAQLREAQKLETLGQITGGLAHDMNNLLTPILSTLDLLDLRYGDSDPRTATAIDRALQAAERAKNLVGRMLGFARRQTLETRPVDLAALIRGMRDLLASSVGSTVELEFALPRELPPVLADANQLELAVLNLCINAKDAMPNGGQITLEAALTTRRPHGVQATSAQFVCLTVSDTGVGMDPATLAKAIEPFFSTKEVGKGTGLGLSMVHGFANQSGGTFTLTSRPGDGTKAELCLPVSLEPAAATVRDRRSAGPAMAAHKVLVVDDEPLVRMVTADMLADMGHQVLEAENGVEALRLLGEHSDIDAVVTDFTMPQMTGAELAREMHERHADLPILLITGFAGEDLDQALPQLLKPFRQEDLAEAMERLLSAS